jgi:hypothetical protein
MPVGFGVMGIAILPSGDLVDETGWGSIRSQIVCDELVWGKA